MIHIRPEAYGAGEILPHALVLPDAFLALADEGIQTVLLDLLLAVQTQLLLHLQLHRKPVGVPAGLSRHIVALHGPVAGNHVLDDTGQHMADMGLSIGRGRSVIEGVGRAFLAVFHTFLKNVVFFPEMLHVFFAVYEIQIRRYLVVHK